MINKPQHQKKSDRSLWLRFVYAFATIVTIFAQMSAAAPLLLTDAADAPGVEANVKGLKMTSNKVYQNVTTTISGVEPKDGESFTVTMLGTGLVLNDTATNLANGTHKEGNSMVYSGWKVVNNHDNTLTITRDDDYLAPNAPKGSTTKTPWPITIAYLLPKGSGGVHIDGSDDPPLTFAEDNKLALSVYNSGPKTYKVGDEIDLQVTDEDMISGGEVDVSKTDVSPYVKFNFDKTVKLLNGMGYSQKANDTSKLQTLAPDATGAKAYKFAKDDKTYFYLIDKSGDVRIAWPESDGRTDRIAAIATDAVGETPSVNLTPQYVTTSLKGKDGTGVDLTITKAPGVDGNNLRFDPHSVANDTNGTSTYRISDFPLFYMKETGDAGKDLYSFIYNHKSTGQSGDPTYSLEHLRKAVLDGTPYDAKVWGGAQAMTNTEPAWFENFHQVDADGNAITGTEKQFEPGKTYTMIPYNPVSGTTDRFVRIQTGYQGDNYYMPDGIPTFTLDGSGNFQLKTPGDGNAKKNQWQVNGKTLETALYKVKKVKVIDDDGGKPVSGAKLTLKNTTTSDGAYMKATSGTDGTGELLPNDYDDSKKGPFYYADGTQAFSKLDLPAGYTADVDFSMTLGSTDDKLSLTGAKNAAITDDGQVLTLTVHKTKATDSQINIQKVAKEDPTKTLGGATFNVEEVDNTKDALKTQDVTTGDSDGKAQLTVADSSTTTKRTFHITETTAPTLYTVGNKNGYYATWTKGTGFTAVGETKGATTTTSADKLASVKDGLLTIQDPKKSASGGVGDNGTNGGTLTIKKIDADNPSATVPDGAEFKVTEVDTSGGSVANNTATTKNGAATFNLGDATSGERLFTVEETKAPDGYTQANLKYRLRILPDGQMFLGGAADMANTIVDSHTADNVITLDGHTLKFADKKTAVAKDNGGMFSLAKVDKTNAATTPPDGADFTLEELIDKKEQEAGVKPVSLEGKTSGGKISFDLGAAKAQTRYFTLIERTAPVGYVWNTQVYAVQITAQGVVTVGTGAINETNKATIATKTQTDDKVLTVATGNKGVIFADDEVNGQKNSTLTFKKVDFDDRTKTIANAQFGAQESVNDRAKMLGDNGIATSDANGDVTIDLGAPTNTTRVIKIGEDPSNPPAGYQASNGSYRIYIDPQGHYTVSMLNADGTWSQPKSVTSDNVLQVDKNNQVTFGDKKVPTATAGFKMKKTDQADPTQGVTGTATFTVRKIDDPVGNPFTVTTTDGKITDTALSGLTSGKFSIEEKTAPTGYALEKDVLYFQWSADKGVTAVGSAGESGKTLTAQSGKDVAGNTVLWIEKDTDGKGILNFSDAKKAVDNSTTIRLKKVSASDPTKTLAGAQFSFQEIVKGVAGTATTVKSDADGNVQFTPTPGSGTRIFRIIEKVAPAGYLVAADQYYVQWSDGKILGYNTTSSNLRPQAANFANATLDADTGVLTVQDPEQTATISTKTMENGTTNYASVSGVKLKLSNPNSTTAGTPLTLESDSNGNVSVTASQIASVLGLSDSQMTGYADVRIDTSDPSGKNATPVAHVVRFTFGGDPQTAGFDVYGAGKYVAKTALQQNDKMLLDRHQKDMVQPGNLLVVLRKDTLNVKGIDDKGVDQGTVLGAKFKLTFVTADGTYTTQPFTVDKDSMALPNPNELLLNPDAIKPNQDVTVTLQEVQAPAGYGQVNSTEPETMHYTSGKGYWRNDNYTPVGIIGWDSTVSNAGLPTSNVRKYFNGGSDITYYLLKNITDLKFSNLPANNELDLNFGIHAITTGAQDILLSDTTDLATFEGTTKPTTTLANDPNSIGVSVTQQGQYDDGWTVDLQADPLTSEAGSNGVDTIQGASLLFGDGKGTLTKDGATPQEQSDLLDAPDLQAALGGDTPMLKADGQTAGEYSAAWQTNQVKLHVPGGQGWPDTNYHAAMTWNLVVGGPQN